MHCICSLLLLYSFGNSTEHALSHSGLFLPPVRSLHLTFTLTYGKAGEKGRQRYSNANPQISELPRPHHAVLGLGAQWTATAGLGAAGGKWGWTEDFATTQRLKETLHLGACSVCSQWKAGQREEPLHRALIIYWRDRPEPFVNCIPRRTFSLKNLIDGFLPQLSYSSNCYLNTLRLRMSWASSVTSQSLNPVTSNPKDWDLIPPAPTHHRQIWTGLYISAFL